MALGTLGMARAPGLGSSWKLCETSNFCRSRHQSRARSLQTSLAAGRKHQTRAAEPQVWTGATCGDQEQQEERTRWEGLLDNINTFQLSPFAHRFLPAITKDKNDDTQ